MSVIVREDLSVPLSPEIAEQLGVRAGDEVEWEQDGEGRVTLRAAEEAPPVPYRATEEEMERRRAAIAKAYGMLRPLVPEPEKTLDWFIQWRREDGILDGSLEGPE